MIHTILTALGRPMLILALLAPLVALGQPTPALAATTCPNAAAPFADPPGISFGAQTIAGNLVVPAGGICVLDGTTVTGNVLVEEDALLLTKGGTTIFGSVRADGALSVSIAGGTVVNGGIEVTNAQPFFVALAVTDSRVGGSVRLTGNDVVLLLVARSEIGGNLIITDNVAQAFVIEDNTVGGNLFFDGNAGPSDISNNVIRGLLRCTGNAPDPIGGGNTAAVKLGQCAAL